MSEKITIKNFGGLDEVVIPLNSINIFIGKQASGKSVSAKLIFFFKSIFLEIFNGQVRGKSGNKIKTDIINKFVSYFPAEVWIDEEFEIIYELGEHQIKLNKILNSELQIKYSKEISNVFGYDAEAEKQITFDRSENFRIYLQRNFGFTASKYQVFIPAGRSFFATVQNSIFSLLAENEPIDPFLIEFGRFYNQNKNSKSFERVVNNSQDYVDDLISKILVGKYKQENNKDYIVHKDKRKVELSYASSGQQEVLPISLILARYNKEMHRPGGTTFYIEEPEAHLFPSAQKSIVDLISAVYNNSDSSLQFVITTHSPYILSAFNNLLQAGLLKEQGKDEAEIEKVVSKFSIIKPNELNAFEMRDGKLIDLIDKEYGLITAATLDKASEDIAKEFDALLELE